MALPSGFLDELRARTPLPALIGRRVRLARSGRQWKGCCPFHGEKTPSFYVYDDHFHCFGCGVHGDAISFLMQNQGLAFIEAVGQLAAEAGMEVPKPTPEASAEARARLDLTDVLAAAEAAFTRHLFRPEGARALAYLHGRRLDEATIRRFGLGFAPGRGELAAELAAAGIEPARLVEAGLLKPPEEGGRELFFERVMFPIRDRQGRVISFGGRTLGDGQPKYLNGPETAAFAKRRSLYGLDLARAAVRQGAALVVVEGYMDVIALHRGGFAGALAPLGTAVSTEQLDLLWQLSPAPVLCFDGDAAGGRAVARAAELALTQLGPERTLRIARLPAGEDPDTLIARAGPAGMQAVLEAAVPLSEALFDLLSEGQPRHTPEQRAALRARLEAAAARIPDRALAGEYRRSLLDSFFASGRTRRGQPAAAAPVACPPPEPAGARGERLRILTAILLRHPALLADVEEAYQTLDLPLSLSRIRDAVMHAADRHEALDSRLLIDHLTSTGSGEDAGLVLSASPLPLPACAGEAALPAEALAGWWHIFGLLNSGRLEAEFSAACSDWAAQPNEANERRVQALAEARRRLTETDFGLVELRAGA